ncbi:hypothetical protein [Nocardia sp. NPDC050406]|uniref:hypothetical protein n=1 Tax=Nocardia sp. NPDC050406 TaxID=3364318 RepID=UPI003787391D
MKRLLAATFAVTALVGAPLLIGDATASAAPPLGAPGGLNCRLSWYDANTAGITCTGGTFVGAAQCANGKVARGAAAHSGTPSYAYCTSFGSSLATPVRWGAFEAV